MMEHIIEPNFRPHGSDVVVRYEIIPSKKDSFHQTLSTLIEQLLIGSEELKGSLLQKSPKIFDIHQASHQCSVAFPEQLFETGNLPQNLSLLAGSILDSPLVKSVKVLNINWTARLQASFPGPHEGIANMRKHFNVFDRPLSSVLLLPKINTSIKNCIEKAYHIWMGGCDMVEESELICSQNNADFEERISYISKEERSCSKRTGQKKVYIPNITAGSILEMQRRAQKVKKAGLHFVVANTLYIGFTALSSLQKVCQELGLFLVGNQAGQRLISGSGSFSISPASLALIYRHIGLDALHIDSNDLRNLPKLKEALTDTFTENAEHQQPSFPICSLSQQTSQVEELVKHLGQDVIIQAGATVYQHPDGIKTGASAFQFAVEAAAQGIDQESAAHKNEALKKALEREQEIIVTSGY